MSPTVLCGTVSAVHGTAPTVTLNALFHAVVPCSYGRVLQCILERTATLNTVQDTVHSQVCEVGGLSTHERSPPVLHRLHPVIACIVQGIADIVLQVVPET